MPEMTPEEQQQAEQVRRYITGLEKQNRHMALLLTTLIKKFGTETKIQIPGGPEPGVSIDMTKEDFEAVNGGWALEQIPEVSSITGEATGNLTLKLVRPPAAASKH